MVCSKLKRVSFTKRFMKQENRMRPIRLELKTSGLIRNRQQACNPVLHTDRNLWILKRSVT